MGNLFLNKSSVLVERKQEVIEVQRVTKRDENDPGQAFIEKVPGLKSLSVSVELKFISSGSFEDVSDIEISRAIQDWCKEIKI